MAKRTTTQTRPGLFGPVLVLAVSIPLLGAEQAPRWDIPVYLDNYGQAKLLVLARAQKIASEILATAGVDLAWHSGPIPTNRPATPACPARSQQPVVIQVDFTPPRNVAVRSVHTLAYTFPYADSGARIHILYDRLNSMFPNSPRLAGSLLGHVVAHEISHMLQRIDRHSNTGIMKANWTSPDFNNMSTRPLDFEDRDILLIRLGLESWARKACPAGANPLPATL